MMGLIWAVVILQALYPGDRHACVMELSWLGHAFTQ